MTIKRIETKGDATIYTGTPSREPASSYTDAASKIAARLDGLPKAVWDGNAGRMVPVAYDVQIVQLVDDEEHRQREAAARYALQLREVAASSPPYQRRDQLAANACLNRLTHAMQSDDGIGTSFMTRSERALASYEWGKRLRDLIEAGKRRDIERERNRVLVDLDYDE